MKLKRPNISPGKWEFNVDTIWRGSNPSRFAAVFHPINNSHSIADAKACACLPEVMDILEMCRNTFIKQGMGLNATFVERVMLKMGYTEEEE